MANPKLDGFTKQNRPYSMSAMRAIQDVSQQGIVELEGIDAKLPVSRKFRGHQRPARYYNREKNTLSLTSHVTVKTTDGMTITFQSAFLEIGKGNMKTTDPVDISVAGRR